MRSLVRRLAGPLLICAAGLLITAAPAAAQGFGIGARLAWVKSDSDVDVVENDSVRFIGGQIRLGLSQRMGVEVSLDRHTESFELLNQRVKETPIQASLLLKLASGSFQPYFLGGPGWYKRSVEPIEGPAEDLELEYHRIWLACWRRRGAPHGPARRHPRRLSLHFPRLL